MSIDPLAAAYRSALGDSPHAGGNGSGGQDGSLQQIYEFIALRHGIKPRKLKPHSQLEKDLKISGAEARELMRAYGEKFGVDMQTFDADRYFSKSALLRKWEDVLIVIISLICVLLASITLVFLAVPVVIALAWNLVFAKKQDVITLQMLAEIAESKCWPE